MSVISKH